MNNPKLTPETESRAPITMKDKPPEELLKFGSKEHQAVIDRLKARLKLGWDKISERYSDWDRVDEQVRMYVNLSEPAKAGDGTIIYGPDGEYLYEMPFERSIVIPASYATLQVRLAQLMGIVMAHEPIWSLDGRGPEDVQPSRIMEACLDYDMEQCRGLLSIYSALQDAEKYGMGILYDVWEEEHGWKYNQQLLADPMARQMAKIMRLPTSMARTWDVVKEYNSWIPIDPFRFCADPRVPKSELQKGEFMGHRCHRSHLWLQERGMDNGGPYFNLEHLPTQSGKEGENIHLPKRDLIHSSSFDLKASTDPNDKGYFILDHLQVKLVPKDWGLGPEENPEIWWFTIAGEAVIIRAHPSSYDHGQFTYAVLESNFDYHAIANPGNMEAIDGLQRYMNWLLNSHLENIRKTLNDALIFAAAFIEEDDITNPGPARHIRLTPAGEELVRMGYPIGSFYEQFAISDVTTPHLQSSQFLFDMIQRMMATNDPVMGHPTQEKKTLGEIHQIIGSATKRLATDFRLYEAQAFHPLVMRAVMNRQQFSDLEQYFRITGDMVAEFGAERMLISPWDIQGNFDYAPRSEVLPPDPAKTAIAWTQLVMGMGKFPQVLLPGPDGKRLDIRAVFNEVARSLGIKNISKFYTNAPMPMMPMPGGPGGPTGGPPEGNVKVMSDESVEKQAQAGNLMPL